MSNVIKFPGRENIDQSTQPEITGTAEVYQLRTPKISKDLTEQLNRLLALSTNESFDFSDEDECSTVKEIVSCLEEMHAHPSEYSDSVYPRLTTLAFKAILTGKSKLVQNPAIIKELEKTKEQSTHPALRNQRLAAAAVLKHLETLNPELPPTS